MKGIDPVLEILRLALYSGYIQGETPLSVLLVAPVEGGKSASVGQFHGNHGVIVLSNFSPVGLLKDKEYVRTIRDGTLRHILIPDMLTPLAKSKEGQEAVTTFLNVITEEGMSAYCNMYLHIKFSTPQRIGLITGIAQHGLLVRRRYWEQNGFMSRMLPVSWTYDSVTADQIFEQIFSRTAQITEKLTLPNHNITMDLPIDLARQVHTRLTLDLAKANKTYGFREQKHFQRLVMAQALRNGRDYCIPDDLDYVTTLAHVINLNMTKL